MYNSYLTYHTTIALSSAIPQSPQPSYLTEHRTTSLCFCCVLCCLSLQPLQSIVINSNLDSVLISVVSYIIRCLYVMLLLLRLAWLWNLGLSSGLLFKSRRANNQHTYSTLEGALENEHHHACRVVLQTIQAEDWSIMEVEWYVLQSVGILVAVMRVVFLYMSMHEKECWSHIN